MREVLLKEINIGKREKEWGGERRDCKEKEIGSLLPPVGAWVISSFSTLLRTFHFYNGGNPDFPLPISPLDKAEILFPRGLRCYLYTTGWIN